MSTTQNPTSAIGVQFFDNYLPKLEADEYTITITQTATSSDTTNPLDQTFTAVQTFSVIAPRFAIPPQDVQSVFPPRNASGTFDQNFAHVVLNERTLPWERLIVEGDLSLKGIPWMALLLFAESEILPPAGAVAPTSLTNPTLVATLPVTPPSTGVDSLLTPSNPAILGPAVKTEPTDEGSCQAIDIPLATFTQVTPRLAELSFLAHARQLDEAMQHKTTDQASGDGWFSVVMGNRFPTPSQNSATPARYIAHLVSLEGFSQYLVDQPAWPSGITTVRLASLLSWSFICLPEEGDFARLATNLISGPIGTPQVTSGGSGYTSQPTVSVSGGGGSGALVAATIADGAVTALAVMDGGSGYSTAPTITISGGGGSGATGTVTPLAVGGNSLLLRLPFTGTSQDPGSPGAWAQAALQLGYAPLAYDTRVGDSTFGWYHGPFVPQPIQPFSAGQPFASSAAATLYDQNSGTFDLSYAAAWETGRMLSLAARAQGTSRMTLNKAMRKSVNTLRERMRLGHAPQLALRADADTLNAAVKPKGPSRSFVSWMGSDLGARLPAPGKKAHTASAKHVSGQTTLAAQAPAAELRSLGQNTGVSALLSVHLTAAFQEPQFSVVLDFLAGLRLLEGLPFTTLVPNAAMLPQESIRFFYVDPNYLNALTDGANSIGLQTTRDLAQSHAVRAPLHNAVRARAQALRPRRIKRSLAAAAASDNASDPVAGFLLRSALVSGWPGLEVKAYGKIANSDPLRPDPNSLIAPLRMERLAPDVLLCLYPNVPAWVELDEPKEGIAFGVEDPATPGADPQVALRYLTAGNDMGEATGTDVTFTRATYLRDPSTQVVNVNSWQAYLSTQVPASTTTWGPAAYAIQMVRAPEQIIFQISPNPVPPESAHG